MLPPKVISASFLLWSQLLLVWSIAAYGIAADPMKGEAEQFRWKRWFFLLACRTIGATLVGYALSRSIVLACAVLVSVLAQPLLRYALPMRWVAEFETFFAAASMISALAIVRGLQLSSQWAPSSMHAAQVAAVCIIASTILLVVRGGTYIVRGILRKLGSSGPQDRIGSRKEESANSPQTVALAPMMIDAEEYNRGRLIGNLERIVLTIVVAAGSYAALAFLVAAKGVVRSEEFENSRDFTEYFLIGSLASVLVALCAGIALRISIVHLWPDLLALQMQ